MEIHFPPEKPQPLIQKIRAKVRNHELSLKNVPEEFSFSFPIPILENDRVLFGFFHFQAMFSAQISVGRPVSNILVKIDDPSGKFTVIKYEIASEGQKLFPELADPDQRPKNSLSIYERRNIAHTLLSVCDIIIKNGSQCPSGQLHAYKQALLLLEWPGLIPFYKRISPLLNDIIET